MNVRLKLVIILSIVSISLLAVAWFLTGKLATPQSVDAFYTQNIESNLV